MVSPKARLAVSAGLFLAWIGFLVYLVAQTRAPVILSRPQLLVSSLTVLAEVREKDGRPAPTIQVKKVHRALDAEDAKLDGTQITVEDLVDCGAKQGWAGPGEYIVPLTRLGSSGSFQVTQIPPSPGYRADFYTIELVSVGPEKEKVMDLVAKLRGEPNAADFTKGVLRRNVSNAEAVIIKEQFKAAKATLDIRDGESRIYRATTDALTQMETLK